MKFVKILREDLNHNNFLYQEGYNTEVNFDPEVKCDKGLHFTQEFYISHWFFFAGFDGHYRQVITSVNSIKDDSKYKAKTIFIGPKQKFTEEMYIESLKQTGYAISYIKNPSEQLCLEAVKQNGDAIRFIKNPSEEICLEAVRQNGKSIRYMENLTEQIKIEAIKQNRECIKLIEYL